MCGRESADRYVVLGAQRDAWGKGYTKATVGTSVLLELAKAVHDMVEKGNKSDISHTSNNKQEVNVLHHHIGGFIIYYFLNFIV